MSSTGRPSSARTSYTRRSLITGGAAALAAGGAAVASWRLRDSPDPQPASVRATGTPTESPNGTPPATPAASPDPATPEVVEIDAPSTPEEITVSELAEAFDQQQISIAEFAEASLARIEAMDTTGPELRAMIELNPDALDIAEQLDEELGAGQRRGPLHGVPVIVKDVFATTDEMRTTAGSYALAENPVEAEAFVISQLREAGAIVLGKANMSQWSAFRSGAQVSGWSSRGGQGQNPYRLGYSPWGSSSGPASAVAASYAPLAIGGETNGSILCPASACGVVGVKPTVGVTSRSGSIGISFITQDSAGPLARNVRDAALLLNGIAGYDPSDYAFGDLGGFSPHAWHGVSVPEVGEVDYTENLDTGALEGARVGVCRSNFGFDVQCDAAIEEVLPAFQDAGAELIDEVYLEHLVDVNSEFTVLLTEFAYGMEQFFQNYMPNGPVRSMMDIINFNLEHAHIEMETAGHRSFELALETFSVWDEGYRAALNDNCYLARTQGIDATMDALNLDVLIAPTAAVPTPIGVYGDDFSGASAQMPAIAGYPSINLPIGMVDGLPVGMHLFGRAFSESKLLGYAYALEQMIQARVPPSYEVS